VASFAVISFSDTRTEATDVSGQAITELITEAGHTVVLYAVCREDLPLIEQIMSGTPPLAVAVRLLAVTG